MTDTEIYGTDYSSEGFITSDGDLGLVTELDNAEQAIRNRLLTRLGTYPNIDTDYGSNVHLALGEKITPSLISELRVNIENCMLEEPRVYGILNLDITPEEHDSLQIALQLQLVDGSEIGFEERINSYG